VFDGVHGEGIYVQPKAKPHARVIYLPDADGTPEKLVDEWLLTRAARSSFRRWSAAIRSSARTTSST
jgi:hypothetical protein